MPHVTVKLWPGKTDAQKQQLADEITRSVTSILGYGDESVSVAMEEVDSADWKTEVYDPDIRDRPAGEVYKAPGYTM
jgi:4-oxalocrotonate tautomerase